MQKLALSLFIIFIANPLSAQVDSGYIKCNLNLFEFSVALASFNLNPEDYKSKYDEKLKEWNTCIQNYKVPNFNVLTITNDSFSLEKITNKVVILNFWSLNCPPCLIELKVLNALSEEYKTEDIIFVSLFLNTKTQLIHHISSRINTIASANKIFDLYGIYGYPQTIILRKNHMIKHQFVGINVNDIEEFKNQFKIEVKEALLE